MSHLPTISKATLLHALPLLRPAVPQTLILSHDLTEEANTLHTLSKTGDAKLLTVLLVSDPTIPCTIFNKSKRTPLSLACEAGHLPIIQLLCARPDVKPDASDPRDSRFPGRTPLSWAAGKGHLTIVRYLIEGGLSVPDKADSWARTPLLWAVRGGHVSVVEYLTRQENMFGYLDPNQNSDWSLSSTDNPVLIPPCDFVGINNDDEDGVTPLLCAVRERNVEIVKILLSQMDLNVNRGFRMNWRTVLTVAVRMGAVEIVELMLRRADLDIDIEDRDGLTAIEWARLLGHATVVLHLLRARGSRGLIKDNLVG
ncbi:ankyrin repeat-containing domain protein [Aspergillus granulosus]|uniref:Ankyrin repeat-containing domain protein n=1 Tax=Aspergillus granulosus TaxID=176169 RepID=A0ABR4HA80_9EURO